MNKNLTELDLTLQTRQEFGSGDYVEGYLNGDENDHKVL